VSECDDEDKTINNPSNYQRMDNSHTAYHLSDWKYYDSADVNLKNINKKLVYLSLVNYFHARIYKTLHRSAYNNATT